MLHWLKLVAVIPQHLSNSPYFFHCQGNVITLIAAEMFLSKKNYFTSYNEPENSLLKLHWSHFDKNFTVNQQCWKRHLWISDQTEIIFFQNQNNVFF